MTRPSFPPSHIRLKRAYESAVPEDGVRILVDRLWPRGLRKADAALDDWIKEIARVLSYGDGSATIRALAGVPRPLQGRTSATHPETGPHPRSGQDTNGHSRLQCP